MLHTNAVRLADFLFSHCPLDAAKRPILVYGCELALSTLTSFFSIMVISVLLHDFLSSLLFIAIFFVLRLFAGGFHASTYLNCFFITNGVYLTTYGISFLLGTYASRQIALIFGLISGITILFLTPIQNAKHPLSQARITKNKKISRFLIIFDVILLILIFLIGQDVHYFSIFAASLAAVAVMMIIPKLKEGRG